VIEKYGYPVVSKEQAQYISECQNPTETNYYTRKKRLTGIDKKGKQSRTGSWDNNIYFTGLGIISLRDNPGDYSENLDNAIEWLKSEQKPDGSFGTVLDSAMALYAISNYESSSVSLPECNDIEKNGDAIREILDRIK